MIIKGKTRSRITDTVAVLIGVVLVCIFAFLFPHGLVFLIFTNSSFLPPLPPPSASANSNSTSHSQVVSAKCESSEKINLLKEEFAMASETNTALKKQIRQLTERLQLAQRYTTPKKHVFVLGRQPIAGPFGTVKALRTNPTVSPDESVNPRLAKILHKLAIQRELVVALSNFYVKDMLELWFTNLKRVGVSNYLLVALDKETALFCQSNGIAVYERDPDEAIDSVGTTGENHAVSGLKFRILREFLQLGYSVLLSDLNIIYLQNPFVYLHGDSDVESMSDGRSNMTAYGFDDVFDEPSMGWARYAHTIRMWVYNSGFFYIRPTLPSIELLDRVTGRLSVEPKAWDQTVFNEELFHPSYPGYDGLHASRRTMDLYLFMNSKVLFKTVRKNSNLRMFRKPVIIHCNYHPDKLLRLKAIMQYYVHGKEDALDQFPDGSEW